MVTIYKDNIYILSIYVLLIKIEIKLASSDMSLKLIQINWLILNTSTNL